MIPDRIVEAAESAYAESGDMRATIEAAFAELLVNEEFSWRREGGCQGCRSIAPTREMGERYAAEQGMPLEVRHTSIWRPA